MNLNNQTILITGGSSGIGKCLARQLADAGNQVIIASRTAKSNTDKVIALHCDLSDQSSVKGLIKQLDEKQLHPNVLINNAGVQYTPKFTDSEFDFESIETEMTINFTAAAWLTSLLLPTLGKHPQAAIINISSGLALYPKTSSAIYCASKAALHNFSQCLRYQLEGSGIAVHEAIMPLVDTPMTRGRGNGKISPAAAANAIVKGIERDRHEIYIGKARLLPLISRVAPGFARKILKNY